ncbi:MAG: ATP-binding cassette domain-containing protein, partial [Synergistaceae bacterium]|nr:ATP-binding cassette domain-containing protein [Synergistaceae bacterium]
MASVIHTLGIMARVILSILAAPITIPVKIIMLVFRAIGRAVTNLIQAIRSRRKQRQLRKREKEMKLVATNEMKFAILGPSGAGKTTLLACMAEEFERVSPGTIFPADPSTFGTL